MAKDNKKSDGGAPKGGDNVISLNVCPMDKCGKRATRAQFCDEHFGWFKEGLIAKNGEKPKDFDKKFQAYNSRNKKTA